MVVGPPRFDRFPVLPQPLRYALGAVARELARRAARVASRRGALLVRGFDGAQVARDGFHPDAAGYDAMAETIARALGDQSPRDQPLLD